jgi:hypothetical protein
MHLPNVIKEVGTFISEAMSRLFGVTDDAYPATGVQPYAGRSSRKRRRSHWNS